MEEQATTQPTAPTPGPVSAAPQTSAPKKSHTIIIVIIIAIIVTLAAGVLLAAPANFPKMTAVLQPTTAVTAEPPTSTLAPEIEAILVKKMALVQKLASDSALITSLTESGLKNSTLTKADIARLDDNWKNTQGDSDFSRQFLNNPTAQLLKQFQEDNPGFPEVFATDAIGLNVGQTDKTSDYYQADEDWWTGAYNNGLGKAYHGPIEYDQSAQSRSISLYVPVYNEDKKVVGIIKAVLDITAIQQEL